MSLLVIGTLAYDTVETNAEKRTDVLGGSAMFFSVAAAAFRPELVLMDLGMPKMDGYEAARRIRAEPWGGARFLVALTGWGADDDRERTRAAGFDRHLVKPVDPAALTTLIAELPAASP